MSICQTTRSQRPLDSRGVALRASNISTLRLKPTESGDVAATTGVTLAAIKERTLHACLADHFQGDKQRRQR